jgi:hypothetical protein
MLNAEESVMAPPNPFIVWKRLNGSTLKFADLALWAETYRKLKFASYGNFDEGGQLIIV